MDLWSYSRRAFARRGEEGWHPHIPLIDNPELKSKRKKQFVTRQEYFIYRVQIRTNEFPIFYLSGRLFQEWIVEMYMSWENDHLDWLRKHQNQLRSDTYNAVCDAVFAGERDPASVGQRVYLPATFLGGPRCMYQLYLDSMAIVCALGKPDLFITFTCNPKWPEIQSLLPLHLSQHDLTVATCRVFHIKLANLMEDLLGIDDKPGIFGRVIGKIYVIEYQKRGLPHAHILLILHPENKPRTPEDINRIVSAELPDRDLHPLAYETVLHHMLHGPCGNENPKAPCMRPKIGSEPKCSKHYPKSFQNSTIVGDDGYPLYRRRNTGDHNCGNRLVDNSWVVPHNDFLCEKFDAHINVEICSTIRAVKYLYKYLYKGNDKIIIKVNLHSTTTQDEIETYLNCRYVSSTEACWRLFAFKIHEEKPAVEFLDLHLPNQQTIYFNEIGNLEEVALNTKLSKLHAWFLLNRKDDDARTLTYLEMIKKYRWDPLNHIWKKRTETLRFPTIGRLPQVFPKDIERFYLRLLLQHVRGATSFEDICTVNKTKYKTFADASRARGLAQDDSEWDDCLKDGSLFQMPNQLRTLFVIILIFCTPNNANALWQKYKKYLGENFIHDNDLDWEQSTLNAIQILLNPHGCFLEDYGLPSLVSRAKPFLYMFDKASSVENRKELSNQSWDIQQNFNIGQCIAFATIMAAFHKGIGGLFFIDDPAGTGKTYLYNCILAEVRSRGQSAIAVASSGVAAILLSGGTTAHSRFRISLEDQDEKYCSIKKQSDLAASIRKAKIIIWDEAPMLHRDCFDAVNRSLKDITNIEKPFGGILTVLGGDLRQTLPVIPKGSKDEILDACFSIQMFAKI